MNKLRSSALLFGTYISPPEPFDWLPLATIQKIERTSGGMAGSSMYMLIRICGGDI
jgi:hypothetical protein